MIFISNSKAFVQFNSLPFFFLIETLFPYNQLGDEVDLDLLVELRAGREREFLIGELRYDKDERAI